jgi:hypothetical protein
MFFDLGVERFDEDEEIYNTAIIARCTKGNHIMTLKQNSTPRLIWFCNGGACGDENSRSTYKDWPADVLYYTCLQCNQDFCPKCFHVVQEKNPLYIEEEDDLQLDSITDKFNFIPENDFTEINMYTSDDKVIQFKNNFSVKYSENLDSYIINGSPSTHMLKDLMTTTEIH